MFNIKHKIMRSFNSIALALIITITSFSITSCDNKTKEYNKKLVEADAFFEKENYNDALRLYKAAIKIKPDEKYPSDRINEINKIKKLDEEK